MSRDAETLPELDDPASPAHELLESGTVVDGRYSVERGLSAGGTGVVYKAYDLDLERNVALKLLQRPGPDEREVLRREAVALARLRSSSVVAVYGFGDHEDRSYVAMEFVAGRNLAQVIRDHRIREAPIPLHRGVQILCDVCDGLAAIHGAGLIHRDIKPGNVVIEDHSGRVVIVDFGAAIESGTPSDRVVGTPAFLAPELWTGATPSTRSDMYALGCTAFELLTGRLPYEAEDSRGMRAAHARAPIPRADEVRPELSALAPLFTTLLAKDPEDRPPGAAVVSNRLAGALRPDPPRREDQRPSSDTHQDPELGINILVVDDDPVFAKIAARCARVALSQAHVTVSRASNGERALAKAARRRPDLVVLDYLLPDMNGVEILSRLRAMPGGSHPEVVVASSSVGEDEQWRFGILGVRDFIRKPIDFTELVERLHAAAQRRAWTRTSGAGG